MKKTFSLIGMICGVLVVVIGIFVLTGLLGGHMVSAGSAPYRYDSGYATFGADFYTYTVNNAEEAAEAGRAAAANAREIGSLFKNVSGFFFIAFGLFMTCLFGTKLADYLEEQKRNTASPSELPQPDELPEI